VCFALSHRLLVLFGQCRESSVCERRTL
jgi:hypothetical protein